MIESFGRNTLHASVQKLKKKKTRDKEGGGVNGRGNNFQEFHDPCQAAQLFSLLNIFQGSALKM